MPVFINKVATCFRLVPLEMALLAPVSAILPVFIREGAHACIFGFNGIVRALKIITGSQEG